MSLSALTLTPSDERGLTPGILKEVEVVGLDLSVLVSGSWLLPLSKFILDGKPGLEWGG